MASPVKIYQKEMYQNLGFFATWFPGDKVELGEAGVLKNGRYRRESSLSEIGIDFKVDSPGTPQTLQFTSASGMTINTSLNASATHLADAEISVEFSNEGAFLFHASGVKQMRIEDGTWVEAQPVMGDTAGSLSRSGLVARFAAGTFAAAAWMGAFAVSTREWSGLAIIASASVLAFAVGTAVCLRRPATYFKSMGFSVCATGLIAILASSTSTVEPSASASALASALASTDWWFIAALNGTLISVLTVNLLAWKRDATMRKRALERSDNTP
jgi:hypothetical protein